MGWLIFLGGAMFGSTVGIFTMCLLQVNHLNEADSEEKEKPYSDFSEYGGTYHTSFPLYAIASI